MNKILKSNKMSETYPVTKENKNCYIFTTKNDIEYELILRASGIVYNDSSGKQKNVIELALNCEHNFVSKDYKTIKTIVAFSNKIASRFDALYLQMHNKPEKFDNNVSKRRGLLRLKLWSRLIKNNFKNCVFLTNQILDSNEEDILCLVIKKDAINYNQIVTNFYRF